MSAVSDSSSADDSDSGENGRLEGGRDGGAGLVDCIPCRTRSKCPLAVANEFGGFRRIMCDVIRGNVRRYPCRTARWNVEIAGLPIAT